MFPVRKALGWARDGISRSALDLCLDGTSGLAHDGTHQIGVNTGS